MGQLHIFCIGGNDHGVVPEVGAAFGQVVAHILIFRHDVRRIAGVA